jgi:hypothetical protein
VRVVVVVVVAAAAVVVVVVVVVVWRSNIGNAGTDCIDYRLRLDMEFGMQVDNKRAHTFSINIFMFGLQTL